MHNKSGSHLERQEVKGLVTKACWYIKNAIYNLYKATKINKWHQMAPTSTQDIISKTQHMGFNVILRLCLQDVCIRREKCSIATELIKSKSRLGNNTVWSIFACEESHFSVLGTFTEGDCCNWHKQYGMQFTVLLAPAQC